MSFGQRNGGDTRGKQKGFSKKVAVFCGIPLYTEHVLFIIK